MGEKKFDKVAYNRYKGKITCAYQEDLHLDKQGRTLVFAKRTKEREKYLFQGFGMGRNPILIECPSDMLVLEFEGTREINLEVIKIVEQNLQDFNLDYCVVDHNGTSPYIYLWNLSGLPVGFETEAKKHIAMKLVPKVYYDLLDISNFGKTLIPVIDAPHWKHRYNGAVHRIVTGKNPIFHRNSVRHLLEGFELPQKKAKQINDPDEECRRLKASVKLSDVLKRYGMDVSRNLTKCLWHDSKSGRNFRFNDTSGLWKCWSCDKAGNVFQFIMEQERCGFIEAKRKLAKI